jgi:hypothetical protein
MSRLNSTGESERTTCATPGFPYRKAPSAKATALRGLEVFRDVIVIAYSWTMVGCAPAGSKVLAGRPLKPPEIR